ncbi:Mobile element protein (plasmid) [Rhodococcus sp. WAY2]|nr:Mobile element protein [Rhodococcus sp. WAY2]
MKPVSDRRLSDVVSVGLLTRVFPASLVDEVIAECGRREQRSRTLTARVTAYFAIGMALNSEGSYEEVFEQLTDGLSWSSGWSQSWSPPTKSAIFQARSRLGYEPVRELFRRVARPLADTDTPGSWLAGRRLVALDGTCLDLPDTPANVEHFGRPASSRGEKSAFPQARLVAVAECGTHAVFDAAIGPCRISERELAHDLMDTLEPGMLLLADRGFYGFDMWTRAAATGADLLWRVKSTLSPRHLDTLDEGSWLAQIVPTSGTDRQQRTPLTVRVIDYTLDDGRENPEQYRLLTTILDPLRRTRGRTRPRLRPALGNREHLRRTQNPPTRPPRRPAVEIPTVGPPGNLGAPVLPLRHPHPDARRRNRRPT